MRLIKLALISLVVLFSVVTFIGLLFPSKVIVSRAIDVAAPLDSLSKFTKDLYGWQHWINSMKIYPATSAYSSKIGTSTITITSSAPTKVLGKWIEKNGDEQLTTLVLISNQQATIVNWQFEQKIKWYPWARLSSMLNEKVIGAMMEENLAHLKKVAEK